MVSKCPGCAGTGQLWLCTHCGLRNPVKYATCIAAPSGCPGANPAEPRSAEEMLAELRAQIRAEAFAEAAMLADMLRAHGAAADIRRHAEQFGAGGGES